MRALSRRSPGLVALIVVWFEGLTPLMVLFALGAPRALTLGVLGVEVVLGALVIRGLAREGRREAAEASDPASPAAVSRAAGLGG